MIGENYLLDTNIVIGLFANDSSVVNAIKSRSSSIFIPSIVFGELFYGAHLSSQMEENINKIVSLSKVSLILECDLATAGYYGRVKAQLKLQGTPIPENDIWIAALAQQYNLTVVTRDKHFLRVNSLSTQSW